MKNNKTILGPLLALTGFVSTILGTLGLSLAEGWDGLVFAPLIWGGPILFIIGILVSVIYVRYIPWWQRLGLLVMCLLAASAAFIIFRDGQRYDMCSEKRSSTTGGNYSRGYSSTDEFIACLEGTEYVPEDPDREPSKAIPLQ